MDRTERVELTTCVMVTDGARMLVQQRVKTDWTGVYFPGGHVEPGESCVRAAIREVKEETGLTVDRLQFCGLKQFPLDGGGRYLVLFFKTDHFSGELCASDEGPVFWITREELPNYRLTDGFVQTLRIFDEDDISEFYWRRDGENWMQELL